MSITIGPGEDFAGYRIDELIGRGGMGVVYRATDLSLERPVALKLIAPEYAENPSFRRRFLKEPKLAAALDHPNVVPIYEAREHDGQLYLAMRFVAGTDLRTRLAEQGTLDADVALHTLAQVADALDAAHRRGLVHRDVKPANILLDDERHAYLTDFGISKQLSSQSTATEQVMGTLDYMAPERIRGERADGRSDQYALACVLYECLTGTPPFRRETEAETLWAHMQGEPPAVPGHPELDKVIAKGLAKDPDDRYDTCTALIDAARPPAVPGVRSPRVRRRMLRRRSVILAGGLVLVAAAAAAAVITSSDDRAPQHGRADRQRNRRPRRERRERQRADRVRDGAQQRGAGGGRDLGPQHRTRRGHAHRPGDEARDRHLQAARLPDRYRSRRGRPLDRQRHQAGGQRDEPHRPRRPQDVQDHAHGQAARGRGLRPTGASRGSWWAPAPCGRSTPTARSRASTRTRGGGWRTSTSKPTGSRPPATRSGCLTARPPSASTRGPTSRARGSRSAARCSRRSRSAAATYG